MTFRIHYSFEHNDSRGDITAMAVPQVGDYLMVENDGSETEFEVKRRVFEKGGKTRVVLKIPSVYDIEAFST